MYGGTETGGQRSSQAGSPNKDYWHERINVCFNLEYLESFSLARTKAIPPFPQDHRWMSKLIWSCLSWWYLNTSCFQPVCSGKSGSWCLNSDENHTRWVDKLWLLLATPSKTNALSESSCNQDVPSQAPNLSRSSTSVLYLLSGPQQEPSRVLPQSTLTPFL